MGQYYKIVNFDKKEVLYSWDYDCGSKLMEFSYIGDDLGSNGFVGALINLLQTDWKGDRVLVVGDYSNVDYANENLPEKADFISSLYGEFGLDENKSFYFCDEELGFKKVSGVEPKKARRYLVNKKTKEYVDLTDIPIEWSYEDDEGTYYTSIFPLMLLIAFGNGLGMGDYMGEECSDIGSWCDSSDGIEFVDTIPKGFEELRSYFTENDKCVFLEDLKAS